MKEEKANRDELGQLKEEVEGVLERKADKEQIEPIKNEISEILRQTRDHKLNILDQQRRLTLFLEEARKRLPELISTDQIKKMLTEEDYLLDAMYVTFEDQFRETRGDIKEKLGVYLPYMEKARAGSKDAPILDVGCGWGEWLELCKENHLKVGGVDINRVIIAQCIEAGFDVAESDVIAYLRAQKANSLGAITGFHIIEHLPLNLLLAFIDEAIQVIRPGGGVIFETPNPRNTLVSMGDFYMDPTHRNPIHPDTINFLLESRGLVRTASCFFVTESGETKLLDSRNAKFDVLDNYLEVSRDFAALGYNKP